MPTFRLDQESWIPVVRLNGTLDEVSLHQVFSEAEGIAGIAGSPVEAASIARFLLAIVHLTDTPASLDAWRQLWENRSDLMSHCAEYVENRGDVWDMFHARHPFGQDADQSKTRNPAHILSYEAARKNNPVHADHSLEGTPLPVGPSRIARGLFAANAYAGSSGGGYRSGPLCMRSVAVLVGSNLRDTLLLNLLVQKVEPAPFDWKTYGTDPQPSVFDLPKRYLWHSRCVLLMPVREGITREIMLAPGNEMSEDERKLDPMVVFRLDSQGKEYIPLRLDPGRALWRSAHVLLNWHEDTRRLAALDQLRRLLARGYLPSDLRISLRVIAVSGDAQGPRTDLWRDETLPFEASVIGSEERFAALQRSVSAAEDKGSETRKRIYSLAARYLQNGADSKPDKADIGRLADELSPDLTDYWAILAPAGERIACDNFDEAAWDALLKKAANTAFDNAVDRLPPDARRLRAQYARTPMKQGATA
jgi:CRISPR system Cascade subunit CasA